MDGWMGHYCIETCLVPPCLYAVPLYQVSLADQIYYFKDQVKSLFHLKFKHFKYDKKKVFWAETSGKEGGMV